MTSPVIEHLDAFEAEIVAIAMTNIILDKAVMREVEESRRREEEEEARLDAEANFRRTGGR